MKIKKFQSEQEWMSARRGKITGSKLKNLYSPLGKTQKAAKLLDKGCDKELIPDKVGCSKGTVTRAENKLEKEGKEYYQRNRKMKFYELIAERIGVEGDDLSARERGNRLESEACAAFEDETEKEVNDGLVIWEREDNGSIAISPDGMVDEIEAVEFKCLSSARHVKAIIEDEIPEKYEYQITQYFIVNDDLEKLNFVMYDPRIKVEPLKIFEVKREDIKGDIKKYKQFEEETLEEIDSIVCQLTDF